MFGEKQPFSEAQRVASGNSLRIYQKRPIDQNSGYDRIHTGGFPEIGHVPKFKLSKSGKVFTIGSCFARNIEIFLGRLGVDCLTEKHKIPDRLYELTGIGARNGALNAYTPHSMRELVNIHSRGNKHRAGMLQLAGDEWVDMTVTGVGALGLEDIDIVRGAVLNAYAELPQADTVIITLGYTEAWYDLNDEMFVNRSPAGSMKTMRKADRYAFFNAGPADVMQALDDVILNIRRQTGNRSNIIITVSPVPLHATFTGLDVVSANLYSKSTLISSALNAAGKYSFVDYFPSYEMVTFSDPGIVWESDGIHVKPEVVKQVVERFSAAYFSE